MAYHVTVDLIVDVDERAEAYDALSAILTEAMRKYRPASCLVDWRLAYPTDAIEPIELPADYEPDHSPWPY